ncbi:MAG: cytochrome b/b6 domain-containing protein [Proteobacteria bacterium]|nr:cytochrome b/b6 domain-containing protein [Pseudomonadota bacterium]
MPVRPPLDAKVKIEVWDLPTRVFHWALVICLAAQWFTGEFEFQDLHEIGGVTVLILVLFRLIWGFVGGEFARFSAFVRGPSKIKAYLASRLRWRMPKEIGHNPIGGWSVMAMLAALLVQATLGLFGTDEILYDAPLSHLVTNQTARFLTGLHEDGFDVILALVGLHLSAIAFYFVVFRKNLVTPMLRGTTMVDPAVLPSKVRPGRVWLAIICLGVSASVVIRLVYFT